MGLRLAGVQLALLTFFSNACFGENSIPASLWNQAISGHLCAAVSAEDVRKSGFGCGLAGQNQPSQWIILSADYLEGLVMAEAAKDQILKNRCLSQELDVLLANEKTRLLWESGLASGWISLKKAQLMRSACEKIFWPSSEKAYVKRFGAIEGERRLSLDAASGKMFAWSTGTENEARTLSKWASANQTLQELYKGDERHSVSDDLKRSAEICANQNTMAALDEDETIFRHSQAIVGSQALFDAVETSREMIVDRKSGRYLSDDDLLRMDLGELLATTGSVSFKPTKKFDDSIRAQLKALVEERDRVASALEKAISANPPRALSEDLRDALYNDGTINQVLINEKLASGPDSDDMIPGGACILARYQPSAGGELVDFVATSAFAGVAVFKYLRAAGSAADYALLQTAKVGSLFSAAPSVYKSCFAKKADSRRAKKIDDDENKGEISPLDLPPSIGYRNFQFQLPPKSVPACALAQAANLDMSAADQESCIRSVLQNSPLRVGLPALAGLALTQKAFGAAEH